MKTDELTKKALAWNMIQTTYNDVDYRFDWTGAIAIIISLALYTIGVIGLVLSFYCQ